MGALDVDKSEAFVKALVQGLAPRAAGRAAGYGRSWRRNADRMAARDDIQRRVAKGRWEKARDAADLTPVITALMDAAEAARKVDNAAAFVAVRGLLVEAARLKGLPQAPATPPPPRKPEMTEAEWIAAFASKVERLP